MALGRFKMTDALPPQQKVVAETSQNHASNQAGATGPARKGKGKGKAKSAGKAAARTVEAEQVREDHESAEAHNAEASTRDRMVDIGRGNQQAGRQRAK